MKTTCPDCGVAAGAPHEGGCDVARCLWTGRQRIQCDFGLLAMCCAVLRDNGNESLAYELGAHYELDDPDHNCGQDVWTGHWPGELDAVERGLWCYWGPPWIPCGPEHPDARPDLNRLTTEGRWDREVQKWVAA